MIDSRKMTPYKRGISRRLEPTYALDRIPLTPLCVSAEFPSGRAGPSGGVHELLHGLQKRDAAAVVGEGELPILGLAISSRFHELIVLLIADFVFIHQVVAQLDPRQVIEPVNWDRFFSGSRNPDHRLGDTSDRIELIGKGARNRGRRRQRKISCGDPAFPLGAAFLYQTHAEERARHAKARDGCSAKHLPAWILGVLVIPDRNLGVGWDAVDVILTDISGESFANIGSFGI